MSELPSLDVHKAKALELAVQSGGEPKSVVERAHAYHGFLTGKPTTTATATAPATATTGAAKAAAAPAAGAKAAAAAAPAAGAKAAAKPAASTGAQTGGKPAAKPAAATPAAAKAAAKPAASTGAPPQGDTKDPNGNNTFNDVTAALQKVMRSVPGDNEKRDQGRKLAYEILAAKGGGVKRVSDLKPALYDTVVAACDEAAKPKAAAAAAAVAAPKAATVATDDFGVPIDTSGASAETATEDDPPEGGSGEGEDV